MRLRHLIALPLLIAPTACGVEVSSSEEVGDPIEDTTPDPAAINETVAALHEHTAAFMEREEHTEPRVKVRHLLVAFRGSGVPGVRRTRAKAEELAAQLYQRAVKGEDFAALVAEYSNDSPEGVYTMLLNGPSNPPATFGRFEMVPAFGNAGWRLQPGELGVVEHHPVDSPYGWHLVMRLE